MKKRAVYILLLCTALLLAVGIAPIPSHTAASLEAAYALRQSTENGHGRRVGDTEPLPTQLGLYHVYLPQMMGSNDYVFLQSWGNEIGVFQSPNGIAVGEDRVYVCDTLNHRIQVFDLYRRPLNAFGGADPCCQSP